MSTVSNEFAMIDNWIKKQPITPLVFICGDEMAVDKALVIVTDGFRNRSSMPVLIAAPDTLIKYVHKACDLAQDAWPIDHTPIVVGMMNSIVHVIGRPTQKNPDCTCNLAVGPCTCGAFEREQEAKKNVDKHV